MFNNRITDQELNQYLNNNGLTGSRSPVFFLHLEKRLTPNTMHIPVASNMATASSSNHLNANWSSHEKERNNRLVPSIMPGKSNTSPTSSSSSNSIKVCEVKTEPDIIYEPPSHSLPITSSTSNQSIP
jgi:hypothetical protein